MYRKVFVFVLVCLINVSVHAAKKGKPVLQQVEEAVQYGKVTAFFKAMDGVSHKWIINNEAKITSFIEKKKAELIEDFGCIDEQHTECLNSTMQVYTAMENGLKAVEYDLGMQAARRMLDSIKL
jgi:hypothetical protein